ncbi:MAG: N-acetylmuramoyl-L-alanine amidase [Oscillospiraceae bacterium]|nr:N-acetylmuramoyl-L-alanine amidase [Oscillospiraceae bacterium]
MFFFRIQLRRCLFYLGCIAAFAFALMMLHATNQVRQVSSTTSPPIVPVIIVDPGHGGEDGGAVGIGGVVEKELNLAVAMQLAPFLRALGYDVQLTRCEDCDLSEPANTLRERKRSDIQARHAMLEELRDGDLFLSVHMNRYTSPSARGTQVFYSPNHPQSQVMAEQIQRTVVTLLQPENHRQIKPAGSSIYLLHRATRPAVMVECGFISNPGEAAHLQDAAYQRQLAFAVAVGVLGGA